MLREFTVHFIPTVRVCVCENPWKPLWKIREKYSSPTRVIHFDICVWASHMKEGWYRSSVWDWAKQDAKFRWSQFPGIPVKEMPAIGRGDMGLTKDPWTKKTQVCIASIAPRWGRGQPFSAHYCLFNERWEPDRPTLRNSSVHLLVHMHSSTNQMPGMYFMARNWRCHLDF